MQSARGPPDAGPSGRAPEPAPRPAAPPRVGAELIAPGDRFVLWCAQDAVRPVLDALKRAGVDTRRDGPLDRFHHSSLHEARRRRHRRASAGAANPGPPDAASPSDAPLPPVANCAAAMACSEFHDAPVFSFEVPIASYARLAKALKRHKLVHPNYTAEADGGPQTRRAMLPSSTFLAVTTIRARTEGDGVRCLRDEDAARLAEPKNKKEAEVESAAETVDRRFARVPRALREALHPFQERGVRFGLERNGRCLIADEMGVGKTIQALAIASCFLGDGPALVVCPASMRLTWAREAERWLPDLRPANLVVVNGSADAFAVDDVRRNAEALKKAREEERRGGDDDADGVVGVDAAASVGAPLLAPTEAASCVASLRTQVAASAAARARREAERPRVVVVSFQMAARLQRRLRATRWGAVVVDESHALRTAWRDGGDTAQTSAVLGLVRHCARAVLCTGTPSLTKPFDLFNQVDALRPGLLGASKRAFAETYCDLKLVSTTSGPSYDRSGGSRLQELHALLTKEVMIRRLKSQVLRDLPPKRRQVVPVDARNVSRKTRGGEASEASESSDESESSEASEASESSDESDDERGHERRSRARAERALEEAGAGRRMSRHRDAALVKLPGAIKWLKEVLGVEDGGNEGGGGAADADFPDAEADAAPKMVIFAHHKDVMDSIANQVLHRLPRVPARGAAAHVGLPPTGNGADAYVRTVEGFVRLEGATPAAERGEAVDRFRDDPGCRVALVSVTAGGVGVDLSASSSVVFVELPPDASMVEQAEDRVHRRGVRNAVNVYFLLAHGGAAGRVEQRRWAAIERQLNRVRRAVDGDDAVDERGLALDGVGFAFRHGSERQEPRAEEDFTASWLGDERDEKENVFADPRRADPSIREDAVAGSDPSPYAPPAFPTDLWFELSANTGRLHLHARADGAEPLGQSVAPNDLRRAAEAVRRAKNAKKNAKRAAAAVAALVSAAADDAALCPRLRGDVGAIFAAAAFAKELDALTARDRNLLAHGRVPARSPVAETLCDLQGDAAAIDTSMNTSTTRHGGGRRRALPPDAAYRPVLVRDPLRRAAREYLEPYRVVDGAPLCLLCMSARGGMGGSRCLAAENSGKRAGAVSFSRATGGYLASPRAAVAKAREAVAAAEASLRAAAAAESALAKLKSDGSGGALSAAQNVSRRIRLAAASSRAKIASKRLDEARDRADRAARAAEAAEAESSRVAGASSPAFLLDSKADLFCSARCASLDKQANSASELRKLLYARERGVCRACRWDASGCARRIATMRSRGARRKHILSSNPAFGARGNAKLLEQLVRTAWEGHAWHFDHVVAVFEGGGECTVDNGQTLCVLCHKARTAAQAKARADARRAAKRSAGAAAPTKASRKTKRREKEEVEVDASEDEEERGSRRARARGVREAFETSAVPAPPTRTPPGGSRRDGNDEAPVARAADDAYAEDSQLATTDEEAEEAAAARGDVRDVEEDAPGSAPVSDSEPIPETEPFSRATPDGRGDAMTRKSVAGARRVSKTRRASPRLFAATDLGTETAVVPETETQDVGVPAFAGTAPFDPDADEPPEASLLGCEEERRRNEKEASGAVSSRAAKKKEKADPLASLLSDSDDDSPWTY